MASKRIEIIDINDLKKVIKIAFSNWYFLVSFPLIMGAAAFFYTHRLTDIYAAKSQILLKSTETYDYQTQLFKGLGYYESYRDITNQIRVLTSQDLIDETLDRLDFGISYYIVGRIKTTEVYESLPFTVDVKRLQSHLYEKRINIKIRDAEHYELSFETANGLVAQTHKFNEFVNTKDYLLRVQRRKNISDRSIAKIKDGNYQVAVHSDRNLLREYKSALSVNNINYTSILELQVEDEVPAKAKTFLDTLAKVYIEYTLQSEIDINENTLDYISKQLAEVTDILNEIEKDLEEYKSDNSILNLSREENQYFNELVKFDAQRRELNLALKNIDALEVYLLQSGEEELLPPSVYILEDDGFLKASLNKLYSLQIEKNQNLFDATESNMGIQRVEDEISLLKNNLLVYLDNTRDAIREKKNGIKGEMNDYERMIRSVPRAQRDILNIERKLQVNEKMYLFLLEKRANTVIARAGLLPKTKVIESARSAGVVRPNKEKVIYMFIGIGFLLAILVILIRQFFFYRIETIKELGELTEVPIAGGVPSIVDFNTDRLFTELESKSLLAESIRNIRTNLQYLLPEKGSHSILVSSLNPAEGKTFISSHLALMLARADQRVIALDFDMHKPKVHKMFKANNDKGISTIIIEKEGISSCIQHSNSTGLDFISSGPIPPNPSELVLSDKVNELLDWCKASYDYVIIDTPPLGLINDGLILMNQADLGLFVLNTKVASKEAVNHMNELFDKFEIDHKALILNGFKFRKRKKYYGGLYGQSYSYSYGYGYGYDYGSTEGES